MRKLIICLAVATVAVSCKKIQAGGNKNIIKLEEGTERYSDDHQGGGEGHGHEAAAGHGSEHAEKKAQVSIDLRKSEVNRMLGRMDELSEFASDVEIPYVVGENVKVIDGPFNGFNGTVEKILEDKKKIEVSVLIFGRKTPMELSYMQVEKV